MSNQLDGNKTKKTTISSNIFNDVITIIVLYIFSYIIKNAIIPILLNILPYSLKMPEFGDGWDYFIKNLLINPLQSFYTYYLVGNIVYSYNWYCALVIAFVTQFYIVHLNKIIENIGNKNNVPFLYKLIKSLLYAFSFSNLSASLAHIMTLLLFPYKCPILLIIFFAIMLCSPILVFKCLEKKIIIEDKNKDLNFGQKILNILIFSLKTLFNIFIVPYWFASLFILTLLNWLQLIINKPQQIFYKKNTKLKLLSLFLSEIIIILIFVILIVFITIKTVPKVEYDDFKADKIFVGKTNNIVVLQEGGTALDRFGNTLLYDIQQVAITNDQTYFLGNDEQVYILNGQNKISILKNIIWISSYDSQVIAVDKFGDLWAWGNFKKYLFNEEIINSPKKILSGMGIVRAEIGKNHILFIDEYKNLYSMGMNYSGVLGVGSSTLEKRGVEWIMDGIIDIAAGIDVSYALTEKGEVYGWGRNEGFQLGLNDVWSRNSPEYIMNNIVQIGVGCRCGYAIDTYGVFWAWGSNVDYKDRKEPYIIQENVFFVADNKYGNELLDTETYFIDNNNYVYLWPYKLTYPVITEHEIEFFTPLNNLNKFITEKLDTLNEIFEKSLFSERVLYYQKCEDIYNDDKENNFLQYSELYEFQGHSYQFFKEKITWKEAKQNCENMGGHLLTITSEEEQEFVDNIIGKYSSTYFSIGLFYDNTNGWEWITNEEMTYKKEIKDHIKGVENMPDLYASDLPYGKLYNGDWKGTFWTDIPHYYICEWDYLI